MNWLQVRQARRTFLRRARITALEKEVGVSLSYPDADLPTIRVVRNPNGFSWMRWVALGFPGEAYSGSFDRGYNVDTYGYTRRGCVRSAQRRLWRIVIAKNETSVEVRLV